MSHKPLSWNEIRQNAIRFSRDWEDATKENAKAQTFWNEFFQIFGVRRQAVAAVEEPVKNLAASPRTTSNATPRKQHHLLDKPR